MSSKEKRGRVSPLDTLRASSARRKEEAQRAAIARRAEAIAARQRAAMASSTSNGNAAGAVPAAPAAAGDPRIIQLQAELEVRVGPALQSVADRGAAAVCKLEEASSGLLNLQWEIEEIRRVHRRPDLVRAQVGYRWTRLGAAFRRLQQIEKVAENTLRNASTVIREAEEAGGVELPGQVVLGLRRLREEFPQAAGTARKRAEAAQAKARKRAEEARKALEAKRARRRQATRPAAEPVELPTPTSQKEGARVWSFGFEDLAPSKGGGEDAVDRLLAELKTGS